MIWIIIILIAILLLSYIGKGQHEYVKNKTPEDEEKEHLVKNIPKASQSLKMSKENINVSKKNYETEEFRERENPVLFNKLINNITKEIKANSELGYTEFTFELPGKTIIGEYKMFPQGSERSTPRIIRNIIHELKCKGYHCELISKEKSLTSGDKDLKISWK